MTYKRNRHTHTHARMHTHTHTHRYAFVQLSSYFAAARALSEINKQPIKGRSVAVDWVVPKDVYEQSIVTSKLNESQVYISRVAW